MYEIITLIVFILLILVIVWGHFLSREPQEQTDETIRDNTNKALYLEHKAEIEADFQQGKIDQENYQYLLTELDKGLLQDIEENELAETKVQHSQKMSFFWPSLISVFILVFSFTGYQKLGAFTQLSQPKNQHANLDKSQQEGIARLEQLKAQISTDPENSNLWYTLGQELVALGDFDNAMKAFDKTIAIEGVKADLLGAKAQAAYYSHGQQMAAEVTALIDQALALDPTDASTNILLGMHAFTTGNYQEAVDRWQGVIDAGKPVNVDALNQAITEAKNRLNTGVGAMPVAESAPAVDPKGVTVTVSLAPHIEEQLIAMADKTVFIYAVPANGPRMPVAAVKLMASDLPVTLTLDDSRAMNPQMAISKFEQVNLFAVVSMAGSPGIKTGDFITEVNNIEVSEQATATLTIDTIAP